MDREAGGDAPPPKDLSSWKLFMLTVCLGGVEFGWALQIGQMTPFLQRDINLSKALSMLVWLVGPAAGFSVQPVVGALSDRNTSKWGRRRPFILGGAFAVAFSLLLIPNAPDLGSLLGDEHGQGHNPAAIALAVLGFGILDCANNMLVASCRSLLVDVAPLRQQEVGNSFFNATMAAGRCFGYLAGTVNWGTLMPWLTTGFCSTLCASARFAFFLSVLLIVSTVSMTCCAIEEVPLSRTEAPSRDGCCRTWAAVFGEIFRFLCHMPRPMVRLCLVQFFSWFAWYAFLITASDWVGQDVNGGSPEDDAPRHQQDMYEEGVRMAQFGLAAFGAVSFFFSPVVPWMISRVGPKLTWALGQLCQGICLCCTPLVSQVSQAILVIALMGISWAVTMTVPYALTARTSSKEDRGLFLGVLNMSIVLPGFVLTSSAGSIIHALGNRVYSVMVIGGASALIGALLCTLVVPPAGYTSIQSPATTPASDIGQSPPEDVPLLLQ